MLRRKISPWKIAAVPLAMFGFAFAMVPLYETLCDLTGFNGRSESLKQASLSGSHEVDQTRQIQVNFLTQVANGMPVIFKAEKNTLEIAPGQLETVHFIVKNRSDKRLIGQAIPSVTPPQAAIHFKKLECFCFQRQEFAAGEEIAMPVRFTLDPEIDSSIQDVSLSYTFYYLDATHNTNQSSIIRTHNQDFSEIKEKS